ncbi:MAG: slipin family protein, partial [Bdellovibrionales bacterium]|nr:slipin family protein [Oligoflexia bacterium]
MEFIMVLVAVVAFIGYSLRVLNEYERGVVFRLGRVGGARGPGVIFLIPFIDKMVRV